MANYVVSFRVPADYKPSAETPSEWKAWFGGLGSSLVDVGRAVADYASAGEVGPEMVIAVPVLPDMSMA
jgi:hypothetical protein